MDGRPLVYLGVGGFLAYLLSKSLTPGTHPGGIEAPSLAPRGPFEPATAVTEVPSWEEAGDGLLNGANDQHSMPEVYKAQVEDVARKIPLSAIQQRDVSLAVRLLGGELDRNGEAFTPRCKAIRKAEGDIAAGKAVTDLFATILSFIPVYGQALKVALSYASNDMQAGITRMEGKLQAGANIRIVINIQQATDTTKMVLGNPTFDKRYLRVAGFGGATTTNGTFTFDHTRQGMLREYLNIPDAVDIYDPPENIIHPRLFTQTRGGYVLPWLAYELGASQSDTKYASVLSWKEACFKRAMCLRVLDLMIAQFWPPYKDGLGRWRTDAADWGNSFGIGPETHGRWSYHNPFFGDVWESAFPPTSEDTWIVHPTDGALDYNGVPFKGNYKKEVDVMTLLPREVLNFRLQTQTGATTAGERLDVTPDGQVPAQPTSEPASGTLSGVSAHDFYSRFG